MDRGTGPATASSSLTPNKGHDSVGKHTSSQTTVKREKKLPACDFCKAKRTKCYPVPAPGSCPRCLHEGKQCITTPVVRRPPRRKPRNTSGDETAAAPGPSRAQSTAPGSLDSSPHSPYSPGPVGGLAHANVAVPSVSPFYSPPTGADTEPPIASGPISFDITDIPAALAENLHRTFERVPQRLHPVLPLSELKTALESANYQTNRVGREMKVLTYCVYAIASLSSIHPLVLGPGPIPASFEEINSWPLGATEFTSYGIRRKDVCVSLYLEALRLAKAGEIHFYPSEVNIGACYLLDLLSQEWGHCHDAWRPWAVAYIGQMRAMRQAPTAPGSIALWQGFYFAEVVISLSYDRSPIVVPSDYAFVRNSDMLSDLEQLQTSMNNSSSMWDPGPLYGSVAKWGRCTLALCHEIQDSLYSRELELTLTQLCGKLQIIEMVATTIISRFAMLLPSPPPVGPYPLAPAFFPLWPVIFKLGEVPPTPALQAATIQFTLLQVREFTVWGWTCPIATVYREIQRRLGDPVDSSDVMASKLRERMQIMMDQMTRMAVRAAYAVGESIRYLPSMSHTSHFYRPDMAMWVNLILEYVETSKAGVLSPDDVEVLHGFRTYLKLKRFSNIREADLATIALIDTVLQPAQQPLPQPQPSAHLQSQPQAYLTSAIAGCEAGVDINADGVAGAGAGAGAGGRSEGTGDAALFSDDPSFANLFATDTHMDLDQWFSAALMSFDTTPLPAL